MQKSKCEIEGTGNFALRISTFALRQPSTSEPSSLESPNDVWICAHHAPHEIGAVVLDHRQNRSLIDAEVIDVEPAERRIDDAGFLLARCGEGGVERIEKAVGRDQVVAVGR